MKTLRQISDEQPVLYAQMALEANNAGKLLIVDNNDQLQLADYPEKQMRKKPLISENTEMLYWRRLINICWKIFRFQQKRNKPIKTIANNCVI